MPQSLAPDATTTMVCGFCSTGCSLNVHLQNGEAVNLTPDSAYPVNVGMACPKGWEALNVLDAPDRATTPLRAMPAAGSCRSIGTRQCACFATASRRFSSSTARRPSRFLSTGQMPTEEMAFLGSLAKFGMGMLHGDGNTRQCMATSVVAYKQSFGFDAPPYTYQDFEESDVIVLVGSNLCIAHPIMWQRVCRNPRRPEIIVIDPRKTETAMAATQHLALKPKSDLTLLYGLAHILVVEGWIDEAFIAAHTTGFEEFRQHVAAFTPERVAEASGISVEQLFYVARTIHKAERTSFWWTMGVNQSYEGVRTAQAIINLALMTGNIGRPGTGANSITGQCNAMGSRLFSNTTNLLGGHDFSERGASPKSGRHPRHRRRPDSDREQLGLRPDHRRHSARRHQGPVGDLHEPGPFVDQPEHLPRNPGPARIPRGAGHVPHHGDRPARRPRVAGRRLGREGRHVHQFRAADRAASRKSPGHLGRRLPTSRSSAWSPSIGAAAKCSRNGRRRKTCLPRSKNFPAISPATSPASPTTA